ncbi:MAG: hypothetical protein IT281_00525, partial [Ignavibacteria bacterium]|nr:hypothetical protein [Ignavibacteria bacterium]
VEAYQIKDISFISIDSILLKRDLYFEIAENNENSVYWEEAVYRYNEESKWLKVDSVDIGVNKKFIEKYPNSYFLPLVFKKLCKAIYLYGGGESEVEEYLNYLMFKHQNCNIYTMALEEKTTKTYLK